MARGTAVGEPVVSQANSEAYDEGYVRNFGDHPPVRGKWIWDERQQRLVSAEDYIPESKAVDAPIMAGRFYENTAATDGSDISTRRRHRDYMKAHGLTTADDYRETWKKAQERREAAKQGHIPDPKRREVLARKMYEIDKP